MRNKFFSLCALPFLPVLLAPFLLYLMPLLIGQVLFWGLPVTQFIPWREYALEQMAKGVIPLWNPLNGMGAPLLANYQLALFYPPGWLVYLAGVLFGTPGMAWMQTLLVPLHLAWAGLGMALLGRRLGFSTLGQAIAGLAFGMSGYWVARAGFYSMLWAGPWLPWVILGASAVALPIRGAGNRAAGSWLQPGLMASIAMELLAGHAQLTWYTLVLAGFWVMVGGWVQGRWKGVVRAVSILMINGLLAAAAAAIQLFPTAEYLLQSQRAGAVDYDMGLMYSFWPWRFLTLLAPGFFGTPAAGNYWGYASFWEDAAYLGFLPLVLGLSTLWWLGRKGNQKPAQPLVRLAVALTLVGAIFALGNNLPLFPFLYRWIPTFGMFNAPARWMIWVVFGLSLLAGLGAGEWKRPTGRDLRRFKRLVAAALAVTLGAGVTWLTLRDVQITFIEATALLGVWATGACVLTLAQPKDFESSAYRRWSWGVVAMVCLDLVWAGWNSQQFVPAQFFAVNQTAMVSQSGRAFLNAADEYAIKFKRFFRFNDYQPIEDWGHLRQVLLPNTNLLTDARFASVNNFDPLVPGRFSRWMKDLEVAPAARQADLLRLMNVTSVIRRDESLPAGISITAFNGASRVRWLACATWVNGEENAWQGVQKGLAGAPERVATLLVLEGNGRNETGCNETVHGNTQIVEESPDRIRIEVDAPVNGFILLADTWYPGWQVSVDGQERELLRANYLFRALSVTAGKHQVEFVYRPGSFYIGAMISGVVWAFMILWTQLIKHRVQ